MTNACRVPTAFALAQHHHGENVQDPAHNIIAESVSHNIPWVGPQMATWRITGYVADSEGEDDEIDFSNYQRRTSEPNEEDHVQEEDEQLSSAGQATAVTNAKSPLTLTERAIPALSDRTITTDHGIDKGQSSTDTEPPTTTDLAISENQLQTEDLLFTLDYGQAVTTDVSPHSRDILADIADDLDSPLSTPPDSPVLISHHQSPEIENAPAPGLPETSTYAIGRNFRPRKAIQINPYLLDFAKHQKDWGERGLKPVQIPRVASPQRRGQEAESQEFATNDESQASANLAQESLDGQEASFTDEMNSFDLSTGLPDLDVVLRENVANHQRRAKPKKTARRSNGHMPVARDVFDLPSSGDEQGQSRKLKTQLLGSFHESIPSPPRSGSLSVHDEIPSVRSEATESPEPLTPAASTGLRSHRWRHVIEDESQSQDQTVEEVIPISSSEESDRSSEMESETENVRVMQKRLRGVIPASYLTVQKAQQAMVKTRHEAAKGAVISTSGPGIAQRKSNKTSYRRSLEETTSKWYEDLASEEDDSQKELDEGNLGDPGVTNGLIEQIDARLQSYEDTEAAETMEDAGIDHMLPARSRTQKARRKQQTGTFRDLGMTGIPKKRRSRHHDADGYLERPRKRVKRPPSRDLVHLLDAPGLSPKNMKRPPWLRIAARKARRTRKPGVSAEQKFIQFDSLEETAAARDSLVNRASTTVTRRGIVISKKARPTSPRGVDGTIPDHPFNPARTHEQPRTLQSPSLRPSSRNLPLESPDYTRAETDIQHNRTDPTSVGRLLSLLQRQNRAGQGRLIFRPTQPRSAQIEEIQQDYRGIARLSLQKPTSFALHREISTAASNHPRLTSGEEAEDSRPANLQPQSDEPIQKIVHGQKPTKKQTPVYRPRIRQTLLAPLKLHTEKLYALIGQTGVDVRTELEREFVAHQAEWFQGRKEGIICANEATQQHFQVFLEVLRSYLSAVSSAKSETGDARGLRSFLYRLVPNRGSIGSQGQVGDKSMDMLDFDILVARNVFDLHVCLLNLAPTYAPLPRVLETKVNFCDAHNEICLIALSAWQAICGHHHSQQLITDGLCAWLYLMLTQLLTRWKSAESDARAEADRSIQRVEERIVRKVIEHNRAQASTLIAVALRGLLQGIEDAINPAEAISLLNIDRYTDFVAALSKLQQMNGDVYTATFKVASSYADQWLKQTPSNITPLLSSLRQTISVITSHVADLSSDEQATMIQAFFSTARIAINHRQKSWDDFFTPTSSFSLDMFVSDRFLDSSKAFFYQFLLETESDVYLLDFRGLVLGHWLHVLLQIEDYNEDTRIGLTRSVFSHEKDSISLPTLVVAFHAPGTTIPITAIRDNVSDIRFATVRHVIAELSGQENNAEAEWLPGGLDEFDAVHLLKTIFSTMKETWMSLSERPEQQDRYTLLIHAALDQYEVHSRSDFVIEAWFFNPAMIPQRRKRTLAKVLTQSSSSDVDFTQDAMEVMQQELVHAKRSGKVEDLTQELQNVLFPRITETVGPSDSKHSGILSRHFLFVQDVLLSFAGQDETSSTVVLEVLFHITSTLEHRLPIHDKNTLYSVANLLGAAVMAISDVIATLKAHARGKAYTIVLVTFELWMSAGCSLPDGFMESLDRMCEIAMQDELTEGMALIEAIVSRG